MGQGELCVYILHLQSLALLVFGLSKSQSKDASPVPVAGEGWWLTAPQHSLLPKGRDPTALRWSRYNGECIAKHLGHFLVWHVQFCTSWGSISGPLHSWGEGVRSCLEGEVPRHGTSCSWQGIEGGRGKDPQPLILNPRTPFLPPPSLVSLGRHFWYSSALCLFLLHMEEENHS